METTSRDFTNLMSTMAQVAKRHCINEGGLYYGIEGAKRFARECGPALLDFPGGERNAGSTYSGICVRAYDLRPPIDAKIWMAEPKKGMERAKK